MSEWRPIETAPKEQQSARFQAEVERMIAAGELSPTEADAQIEMILTGQKRNRRPVRGGD